MHQLYISDAGIQSEYDNVFFFAPGAIRFSFEYPAGQPGPPEATRFIQGGALASRGPSGASARSTLVRDVGRGPRAVYGPPRQLLRSGEDLATPLRNKLQLGDRFGCANRMCGGSMRMIEYG